MEMCFSSNNISANIDLSILNEKDIVKALFSENSGIIIQVDNEEAEKTFSKNGINALKIGEVISGNTLNIKNFENKYSFDLEKFRDYWYHTSMLLDRKQTSNNLAEVRYKNYKKQPLKFKFPDNFKGNYRLDSSLVKPKAAILREQGSNSERELANALFMAGFEVKDVHMTDLISGKESLKDIQFLGAVGGFLILMFLVQQKDGQGHSNIMKLQNH